MLVMKADIKGQKVLLQKLRRLPEGISRATSRAMSRIGKGVYRAAFEWLSGKKRDTGGFPVPVVTGHLRRMLDWLGPGKSKSDGNYTVSTGPMETIVFNSAAYWEPIVKGRGSSAKFGPRDFLQKALDDFNRGDRIASIMDEEIEAELS